jgi:hypothetical protein
MLGELRTEVLKEEAERWGRNRQHPNLTLTLNNNFIPNHIDFAPNNVQIELIGNGDDEREPT